MSSRQASTWLDTILSDRDSRPNPAAAESSPDPKRRRLQPPTPDSSVARGVDNAEPASDNTEHAVDSAQADAPGTTSPRERPANAIETSQASHSDEGAQTPRSEPRSPSPTSPSQSDTSAQSRQCSERATSSERDFALWGLKRRELSAFDPLPPSLKPLLDQIKQFSEGKGILPKSARRRLNKLEDEDMEWATAGAGSNKHYSKEREALGEIPLPDTVRKIASKANECYYWSLPAVHFDIAVNSRVLDMALEPADGKPMIVNSIPSSTASMVDEYVENFGHYDKAVDFCIYLDLDVDATYLHADLSYFWGRRDVERVRKTLPCETINHTSFPPLENRPIALSINTHGDTKGIGIWEHTRWRFFQYLLEKTGTAAKNGGPGLPEFLPAIVVEEDDWYLVITTRQKSAREKEEDWTIVWQQIKMGEASNTQGIYQIVACLQLLRQWARNSFWPWFDKLIYQVGGCRPRIARKQVS